MSKHTNFKLLLRHSFGSTNVGTTSTPLHYSNPRTLQQYHHRKGETLGTFCTSTAHPSHGRMSSEVPRRTRITNYDAFINDKSGKRKPSALREMTKKFSVMPAHTVPLATGAPNILTFPFEEVAVRLRDGSRFDIKEKDLQTALQYLPSSGYAKLVKQLQQLQDKLHGAQDWTSTTVMPTCGSMEGMSAVFDMVFNEGDVIILPVPVYTGTADALRIYKIQYIKLNQDKEDADPQDLQRILEDRTKKNMPLPKLMYVNPTACNPTSRNMSLALKKEFYRLACQYNFLILEDDPYYFVQFGEETIPSFLSIDVEGRVLRMDSFSKVLSSGLRLGFLTGASQLVRQVELHMQTTTLHPSALSQVLVSKLLEHWGFDQYLAHIEQVKKFYRERRDLMIAACDRHLQGLCRWQMPQGGMFVWMQVPVLSDTMDLAVKHCLEHYLLIVPGHPFKAEDNLSNYNYIRLSFSMATPSQMDEGAKLLAQIIRELKAKESA